MIDRHHKIECRIDQDRRRRIGLGGRRALNFSILGLRALDLYSVTQIADQLDISIDWLLGRSNVMNVMEMPEPPAKLKLNGKFAFR